VSLTRKRKKELKQLQDQANKLWSAQQGLMSDAAGVAKEAGRQLGNYNREQVQPRIQANYSKYAAPYVDKGVSASQRVLNDRVIPAAGAVVGSALSVWDAANEKRGGLGSGRGVIAAPVETKKGMGAGGVIALLLGIGAAVGIIYAAWQTLRADDELWVADDPLRAPDA
jgi:hypothetical protein